MKRIHYLLLGLLVSLTIAAVSPGLPPTRIAPGANTTVVTNGINSFTISSSAGGAGAQLDGTNVFTGTNTFTQWSGEVRVRKLFSTNGLFLSEINTSRSTSGVFTSTNFSYTTGLSSNLFTVTLPALKTANSRVGIAHTTSKTNNIISSCFFDLTLGTNLVTTGGTTHNAASGKLFLSYTSTYGQEVFRNTNSFSVQICPIPPANIVGAPNPPLFYVPASYVDTSAAWSLSVNLICNASVGLNTNLFFDEIVIYEYWELP